MPFSKAITSLGASFAGFVAGWMLGGAVTHRPDRAGSRRAETARERQKPLRLQQRIQVDCAGRIYEGIVVSVYIEDGQAVVRLSQSPCQPLDETLWTWEDEGASVGH